MILLVDKSINSKFLRIFKMFGNSWMPQLDKYKISKFGGIMFKFEPKLERDIVLPERARYDKYLKEEKRVKSIG